MQNNNTVNVQFDFADVLACSFHDIKNSLELLAVTLGNLSDNIPNSPEKRDHLSCVQYEVSRISNTLNYMLTVYKMEHQKFSIDLNYHSLFELMEETYYKYSLFTQTMGIDMEIDCSHELVWCFDRNLITIILDEIINNSCRYSKSKLRLSARSDETYLTLMIEDDGVGYPVEFINEFCCCSSPATAVGKLRLRGSRTGLGMHFAKMIAGSHINKMGDAGYIRLNNGGALGGGQFILMLPV